MLAGGDRNKMFEDFKNKVKIIVAYSQAINLVEPYLDENSNGKGLLCVVKKAL